jgi:hypothetical protein
MIDYKIDRACEGYDVLFDGQCVGKVTLGDLRALPEDRRPVTMLTMDKGTKHHESWIKAKQYIESVYQREQTT